MVTKFYCTIGRGNYCICLDFTKILNPHFPRLKKPSVDIPLIRKAELWIWGRNTFPIKEWGALVKTRNTKQNGNSLSFIPTWCLKIMHSTGFADFLGRFRFENGLCVSQSCFCSEQNWKMLFIAIFHWLIGIYLIILLVPTKTVSELMHFQKFVLLLCIFRSFFFKTALKLNSEWKYHNRINDVLIWTHNSNTFVSFRVRQKNVQYFLIKYSTLN